MLDEITTREMPLWEIQELRNRIHSPRAPSDRIEIRAYGRVGELVGASEDAVMVKWDGDEIIETLYIGGRK